MSGASAPQRHEHITRCVMWTHVFQLHCGHNVGEAARGDDLLGQFWGVARQLGHGVGGGLRHGGDLQRGTRCGAHAQRSTRSPLCVSRACTGEGAAHQVTSSLTHNSHGESPREHLNMARVGQEAPPPAPPPPCTHTHDGLIPFHSWVCGFSLLFKSQQQQQRTLSLRSSFSWEMAPSDCSAST